MDWALGIFASIVSGIVMIPLAFYLNNKINKAKVRIDCQQKQNQATQNGVKALLRNDLVIAYEKAVDRGYAPIYERENIEKMYHEYKELEGNGMVDNLIEKVHELPTDPPLKPRLQRSRKMNTSEQT